MFGHVSKTSKFVRNTSQRAVFPTLFSKFGNVIKHGLLRLIYLPVEFMRLISCNNKEVHPICKLSLNFADLRSQLEVVKCVPANGEYSRLSRK